MGPCGTADDCIHEWTKWFPPIGRKDKGGLWWRDCTKCRKQQIETEDQVRRICKVEIGEWERDFRAQLVRKAEGGMP